MAQSVLEAHNFHFQNIQPMKKVLENGPYVVENSQQYMRRIVHLWSMQEYSRVEGLAHGAAVPEDGVHLAPRHVARQQRRAALQHRHPQHGGGRPRARPRAGAGAARPVCNGRYV